MDQEVQDILSGEQGAEEDAVADAVADEQELAEEMDEEDRLRKACNKANQVILYTYGGRAVPVWWDKHHNKLERFSNLTIVDLPAEGTAALAALAERSMTLQVSIQDGEVTISNEQNLVNLTPDQRLPRI